MTAPSTVMPASSSGRCSSFHCKFVVRGGKGGREEEQEEDKESEEEEKRRRERMSTRQP